MAGVQNFVRGRQSQPYASQLQAAGMPNPPPQKLSRAEASKSAKVEIPATRLDSVRPQRSPIDQSSDDYGTNPSAYEQEAERQIKPEYDDEGFGGALPSGFDTDLDAVEESTNEVQVEDSQRDTGWAGQGSNNLNGPHGNDMNSEPQGEYQADYERQQTYEGEEEDPEADSSGDDDDEDEDEDGSGSSSNAEREDEMANDHNEQWPQRIQEAPKPYDNHEAAEHFAPSQRRFSSAPHNEIEPVPPSQVRASAPPTQSERDQQGRHNGKFGPRAPYPLMNLDETGDEADRYEPDRARLDPLQHQQNLQIRDRVYQDDGAQHQQSKPSRRSQQRRQYQEPPRSQPARDSRTDQHQSPYPQPWNVEPRQLPHGNQQPQDALRRTSLAPEKEPEKDPRYQGSRVVDGVRDKDSNRGQSSGGQPQISYPRENPSLSLEPPGSGYSPTIELDYDPQQLSAMDYATLREQPFDTNPKAKPNTTSSSEKPLSLPDQFKSFLSPDRGKKQSPMHNPEKQREFISSLNIEQWEAFGDLIKGGFSDILDRLKIVRQEKRKVAETFEEEIAEREKRVRVKAGGVEDMLTDMKRGGQGVLMGRKG
ncbi:MAG: hypothetical protein M1812_002995 [Candelaria pacifica]|nr:MAG: hypothetical protein M1812_002995 [Candelaria pacifica]